MTLSWIEKLRPWISRSPDAKRSDAFTALPPDELPEHWDPPEALQDECNWHMSSEWRYPVDTCWEDWDERPRRGDRRRFRG